MGAVQDAARQTQPVLFGSPHLSSVHRVKLRGCLLALRYHKESFSLMSGSRTAPASTVVVLRPLFGPSRMQLRLLFIALPSETLIVHPVIKHEVSRIVTLRPLSSRFCRVSSVESITGLTSVNKVLTKLRTELSGIDVHLWCLFY